MEERHGSAGGPYRAGARRPAWSFQCCSSRSASVNELFKMKIAPLRSAKVVGFIPTKNFRRAKAFYATKLGLRFVAQDEFALVLESNGTTIRIARVNDFKPFGFTILGWKVKDVRKTTASLQKRGIRFERFPFLEQDEQGIWTAPGGTLVAWFKDPDGNVLSLSSR
jgi:catechol 2,3-dioxygenase-like lactoylglutathione lyase family enzyme